jgi:4-aminobutyrate aminotransferase
LVDPEIKATPPGPKSREYLERWKKVNPKPQNRPTLVEGDGLYLTDIDGNTYMNFLYMTTSLGHRNPRVMEAVERQLGKTGLGRIRGPSIPRVELMEAVMDIAPPSLKDGRFEFCNTGSDAAEFSMELARAHTGRQTLIAYLGGHYGYSLGTLSMLADRAENRRFTQPLIPGVIHIPYPYCYRCPIAQSYPGCNIACIDYIEYLFVTLAHPQDVAAIFLEPIQQVAGVIPPPKEYTPKLRKLCKENGILLVDDEVATGFGRTGEMFGIEHWGVEPDIMFIGKAFANGISMAGIIANKEIMEKEANFPVVRGGSFVGHPITCAAAKATIEEIVDRDLVANAASMGEHLMVRLSELAEVHPLIGDVRGKGLMIGVELVKDQETKEPAAQMAVKVAGEALKRGLMIGAVGTYRQTLRLTPPLILSEGEADRALGIIGESLREAGK